MNGVAIIAMNGVVTIAMNIILFVNIGLGVGNWFLAGAAVAAVYLLMPYPRGR